MILKIFNLIFFFLLVSASIFSQNNGNNLLQALQNKFNNLSDLTAQFEQSANGTVNLAGKIFYQKGNKLRLELKNITIVSDGNTVWNYNKNQKKVIISNYDGSDPSILSIENLINNYPSKCSVTEETNGNERMLTLIPKDSDLNFSRLNLTVGKNNLIEKAEIDEPASGTVIITLKNYKLNTGINNSEFTFTPPEGCKVIDLR
jgi:chaperone LolA